MLDTESTEDRRVIIEKSIEWQNSKGERCWPALGDTETKVTVWKRHRVPFEEANELLCKGVSSLSRILKR
jgi:hypothetical protein